MKSKHIIITLLFSVTLSGCQISKSYTVTWKNYDGTVLELDSDVISGTIPSYDGMAPSKDGTTQYTYTFSGWSPEVTAVTEDIIYTAQFNEEVNSYAVTWENYDGTVLETDSVAYGTMPSYDGATPSKGGSAQYSYTFSGWSPEVTSVTGHATYTAQFSEAVNSYAVTWKNYNGTTLEVDENVPYGTMPIYDGTTPTISNNAQFTFGDFIGWYPEIVSVDRNVTYTAQFSKTINTYTVTWINYDETILEVDENVPYGTTPSYGGATPSKSGSAQYSYTFSGWSPKVTSVTGDATYIAQFSEVVNSYTVIWQNYNGTVLETDSVAYGITPSYDGVTPTREDGEEGPYLFSGWSPSVTPVNGNQTYTAQYVNGYLEFSLNDDNNSYSVSCRSDATSIIIEIPSTYLEKPVTIIANNAFNNNSYLESIVIPDSVTSIGDQAFSGCEFLTSIVIPDSVTSIGYRAFSGCNFLMSIVISNSITQIGSYTFVGCSSLTSIEIPNGVTSIGDWAFGNCTSLESIDIPNSVTSIGNQAFAGCSSLTSIVIPNSVTRIGERAFLFCFYLTIYAEASSKPSGWHPNWNSGDRPVVWGYVG